MFVLITRGTGLLQTETVRQEAMKPLFDKTIEGFVKLFSTKYHTRNWHSTIQSRAIAGLANANVNLFVYLFQRAHAKPHGMVFLEEQS